MSRPSYTICYEGIFPEISRSLRQAGAELQVNVTNDGWYGISGAAAQHFNFYAMCAVESGMPVVRAANTGKSGWFDTRGVRHDVTSIYTDSAVIASVPVHVENTLYTMLGEWLALPCAIFILGAWILVLTGGLRRVRTTQDKVIGFGSFAVAAVAIVVYFGMKSLHADEANATKALLFVVGFLLLGVSYLGRRPWGRKAVLILCVLVVVGGFVAAVLGSVGYGGMAVPWISLFMVTRRSKEFTREAAPLVHDDV